MFYRECRIVMLFMAFVVVPLFASEYFIANIIIPFYCFALAAFGLNVLAGYTGQISIGHAAFMAVGAYSSFILYGRYGVPLIPSMLGAGLITSVVGTFFGLPSLRIKGFYLAISTLASQFIIEWVIVHVQWISGGVFGTIEAPNMYLFAFIPIDTAVKKYYLALCMMTLLMTIGKNLVRGQLGWNWMAIRDVDYAAEIICHDGHDHYRRSGHGPGFVFGGGILCYAAHRYQSVSGDIYGGGPCGYPRQY
jgi:branched-chain amino acid transport system permease protein